VIVCDDARMEISGKEILIGVYNYIILLAQFPTAVAQFIVRIVLDLEDKSAKKFSAFVKDPNGSPIARFGGDLAQFNYDDPIAVGAAITPVTFQIPGRYTIEFALDDDPLEIISDFTIRLPQGETEKSRVTAKIA